MEQLLAKLPDLGLAGVAIGILAYYLLKIHPEMFSRVTAVGDRMADAQEKAAKAQDDAAVEERRSRRQMRKWMVQHDERATARHEEVLAELRRPFGGDEGGTGR